jgi:biopolymer transport protein TolR
MAMSMPGPGNNRRGRRSLQSEINVTPFVDVMLVLLIVFMVTAPLLQEGIDVSVPKTEASNLPASEGEPLTVSVLADGTVYVMEEEVAIEDLITKLEAVAGAGYEERIFLRGDGELGWQGGVEVMARMQQAGFRNIAILTESPTR